MAAGNDIVEDSFSIISFPESAQKSEDLAPEDVAWIDSCLIKDVEVDDKQWDSLKDALLDILISQSDPLESSMDTDGSSTREIEMLASSDEEENSNAPNMIVNDFLISSDGSATRIDGSEDEIYDSNPSYTESPFLPTYKDEIEETRNLESESNSEGSETEPSSDDIFRVWDLSTTPSEEGELVEQLNKAMAESQVESAPSTLEDTIVFEDLKVESFDNSTVSLDDLILGIGDISLDQKR